MTHREKFLLFFITIMAAVIIGIIAKDWVLPIIYLCMTIVTYVFTSMAMVQKSEVVVSGTAINIGTKLTIVVLMVASILLGHFNNDMTTLLGSIGALVGLLLAVESH